MQSLNQPSSGLDGEWIADAGEGGTVGCDEPDGTVPPTPQPTTHITANTELARISTDRLIVRVAG